MPRSAARTCSTTAIRNYAGDVGIGINPEARARVRDADVLLVIGERLGEMTTSGYTLLEAPLPQADAGARAPRRPTSWAASTSRAVAICATPGEFLAAMAALPATRAHRWREHAATARTPTTQRGASRGRFPATSTCGASCAGSTSACPTTRSSPTARATTRRGCIACSATAAFGTQARPLLRRDGLRRSGGGRRQSRASATASSCP